MFSRRFRDSSPDGRTPHSSSFFQDAKRARLRTIHLDKLNRRLHKLDAKLNVVSGPCVGQTFDVPPGKLLVGREEACSLRVESDFVSRQHCLLLREASTLRIRDLGSKNGTFVNNRRIGTGETILLHGDILSVGDMVCHVIISSVTMEGQPAPPEGGPSVSASAQETGAFNCDTLPADRSNVVSPPSAPPAPTPGVPSVSRASPGNSGPTS